MIAIAPSRENENGVAALPWRRTVMMSVDMVRCLRGWPRERIYHAVESGELRWTWSISTEEKGGCLRFWTREILAPETCAGLEPPEVVGLILGQRGFWHTSALADLFLCSRQQVHHLFNSGALRPANQNGLLGATRGELERFFKNRLASNP